MKKITKTFEVFDISELSEEALTKAYNNWLKDLDYRGEDPENTLQEFSKRFGIRCRYNYDSCSHDFSFDIKLPFETGYQNEDLEGVTGVRLATYIINHNWNDLYVPRTIFHTCKDGKRRKRISKIFVVPDCPLTGITFDMDILHCIYKFIKHPIEGVSYRSLINDCLEMFFEQCEADCEQAESMEAFKDQSNDMEWEYLEDGTLFEE